MLYNQEPSQDDWVSFPEPVELGCRIGSGVRSQQSPLKGPSFCRLRAIDTNPDTAQINKTLQGHGPHSLGEVIVQPILTLVLCQKALSS